MELEDLIESRVRGETIPLDTELPEEWQVALAAHDAIVHALGETILLPESLQGERAPPRLPDDYAVLREIGRGGMGIVYLAQQRSLGREIAVKVLRPGELAFGPLVRRFLEEARHLARLRHPNIVSIHEVGTAGDEPYFTMDYIEGRSLADLLATGPLSPSRSVNIVKQAASALAHAHAQGIIHRDLKPANILIASASKQAPDSAEHVLVSDFGLARDLSAGADQTVSGAILGTPAYMSPEQARGQSNLVGEATDVHALGVMLYEMLTGKPPYGRDSAADVLSRLLNDEPKPVRQIDRRIPRDLETICLKTMAKQPEHRYASVLAFASDLERWERGEAVLARRASLGSRAVSTVRRHSKVLLAATAAAAVALALALWFFDHSAEELVRWGQEEHAASDHAAAIRLFHRAAIVSTGSERKYALELMMRCAREADDNKGIIEAALMIIEDDPNVSFGEYDFLVAQAVLGQVRAHNPNHVVRWTPDEFDPLLRRARTRLKIFLNSGTGTDGQRKLAEQMLADVEAELRSEPLRVDSVAEDVKPKLPQGTSMELLEQAADESELPWQRGLAALSAAKGLEQAGDKQAALEAYHLAIEQMRRVYPFYEGIGNTLTSGSDRLAKQRLLPSQESAWVRQAARAIERLDPVAAPLLNTGIRFRIRGLEIPQNVTLAYWVTLQEPGLPRDIRRMYPKASGSFDVDEVPVQPDGTAYIGVLPGRYELSVRQGSRGLTGSANRDVYRRMTLDFDTLPKEVAIGAESLELLIPARLMQEIAMLAPAPGALVDLQRDVFRWTAVENTERYRVRFSWLTVAPEGHSVMETGAILDTSEPQLRLGERERIPKSLPAGLIEARTATWSVEALDSAGRQLGISQESERAFVVASELDMEDE